MKNIRSTNNSTQQDFDITEPSFFDPHTVTKYFMNQKPLTQNERKKLKSSGSKYNDDLFPNNYNSIEGKDSYGKFIDPNTKIEKATKLLEKDPKTGKKPEFKRIAEIFGGHGFHIFKGKIGPSNIIQMELGNCYFLSALASASQYPSLIQRLFRHKYSSKSIGYYEVILFIDGEWQVVILDDWLVVIGGSVPIKAKFAQTEDYRIWVMLLEKAWAKVNRGYANIVTGHIEDALYSIMGSKAVYKYFYNNTIPIQSVFAEVSFYLASNNIAMANSIKGNTVE